MPFQNKLCLHHLLLLILISVALGAYAQPSSLGFNYQAVARSGNGDIIPNQDLSVRIQLRRNNPNGQVIYEETHQASTNEFGLFNLVIGNGNQVSPQNFNQIDWNAQEHYVQVSINNESLDSDRLEAVPYSKLATNMRLEHLTNVDDNSPSDGQVLKWEGNRWRPASDNTGNVNFNAGNGIEINSNTISNTLPDLEITLNAGQGIEIKGDYPSFEISTTNNGNGNSLWSNRGKRIFYDDGNVGIGTNDPDSDLDVEGNVHILGSENSYRNNGDENTALKIESEDGGGLETMILDGNEIDCINDVFYIQGNSEETLVLGRGGGRVGVGNFADPSNNPPEYTLHVLHRAGDVKFGLAVQNEDDIDNIWTLHNSASPRSSNFDKNLFFVNNGEIRAKINQNGNYSRVSDARLKSGILPLDDVLGKVKLLTAKTYYMKGMSDREMGFMAQDVIKIFPEIVDYDPDTDLYMLNYHAFGVLAIQAIREQQLLIENQQQKLIKQEQRLVKLEERLTKLEKINK